MLTRVHSARALVARGLTAALFAAFTFALIGLSSTTAWSEPKDIRWGTGPVGSVGHKALVILADLLNKEMPNYRITVLPMPGAVMTVKGFATKRARRATTVPTTRCANSPPTPAASRASRRT